MGALAAGPEPHERTRALATLLEVSRNLAATLDLHRVLQATTDGVTRLFNLETAAVYLLEGDTLRLWATTPPLPPGFPDELRTMALDDHPRIMEAMDSGHPVHVADITRASLTAAERAVVAQRNLRSLLFVPLLATGESLGSLIVGSIAVPRRFTEDEIDLSRALGNLAALAVENARLFEAGRRYAAELERSLADRDRAESERLELERRLLHAQKLESLGILAGGVAHDFNNLLMAILGNLDLARASLEPGSPAGEALERSSLASRRGIDLTRQMLAYSGRGRFQIEALDLSRQVEENVHLLRASIPRTVTLELRLEHPLPRIEADAGQVQQVVMNLITNAAEAVGEGSGSITLHTLTRDCDATTLRRSRAEPIPESGRFVVLEVADTGCGMSAETLQRLFDPFFTTKATGRGLGMSAILGIVRGHHGALFVESAPGAGTRVQVLFPAAEPIQEPALPPSGAAQAPLGLRPDDTILVVDDEAVVREVCEAMLQSLGHPVLTAIDGRHAIELFRQHHARIGLVILDLSMPNLGGVDTFTELVRIRADTRVILSSGYDEAESVRRIGHPALLGFIQKPYSLATLRDLLRRID